MFGSAQTRHAAPGYQRAMEAVLRKVSGGELRETRRGLVVAFRHGTASELGALYQALAVACVQKQVDRVLILAGDDDPAGETALRDALRMVSLAGMPSNFKLALVAASPRVAVTYRKAQTDLCGVGITTRLFENEQDATQWLDSADVNTRSA
jgi:hypothetical protein